MVYIRSFTVVDSRVYIIYQPNKIYTTYGAHHISYDWNLIIIPDQSSMNQDTHIKKIKL